MTYKQTGSKRKEKTPDYVPVDPRKKFPKVSVESYQTQNPLINSLYLRLHCVQRFVVPSGLKDPPTPRGADYLPVIVSAALAMTYLMVTRLMSLFYLF